MATGSNSLEYQAATRRDAISNIYNYTDKRISAIDIRVDVLRLSYQDATGATAVAVPSAYGNIFSLVTPTISQYAPVAASDWYLADQTAPQYKGAGAVCLITGTVVIKPVTGLTTPNVISLGIFKNGALLSTTSYTVAVPDYTNQVQSSTLYITVTEQMTTGDKYALYIRNSTGASLNFNIYQATMSLRPVELTIPKRI